MGYQSLHIKTVAELRKLAKEMKVRVPAGTKKNTLIDMLMEADRAATSAPEKPVEQPAEKPVEQPKSAETEQSAPAVPPKRRGRTPKAKPVQEPPKAEEKPLPGSSETEAPKVAPTPIKPEPPETKPAQKPERAPTAPVEKPESAPAAPVEKPESAQEAAKPMEPRTFTRGNVRHDFMNRSTQRPQGNGRGFRPMPQETPARGLQRAPRPMPPQREVQESAPEAQRPTPPVETGSARGRREGYYNAEYKTSNPAVPEMLTSGECADGAGVLEIQQDGYGFLRAENCLPGPNDVYISIAQIRRFNLRMGDYVVGKTRPQREGDRYSAMLYITSVNGEPPESAAGRRRFENLVPIYPNERLRMANTAENGHGDISLRMIDMLAPIGKGQRGMIVSQPKAGKTTLLKKVANAITANYPEIKLIVLLIDERPEEVTDMKRSIKGEVIYSTFDEEPEHHVRVSEMVLERAQRLVEMGQDVVVLMDSITRLARAYNLVITPTGRSLSGGLDPGALFKPKRFFGAARNIEGGGSLTVIATALVETGSRMDDIIFEEFKGTGNMELHLDRKLSDKRVFPAIDMVRSGTRREELLLTEQELDGETLVRKLLSGGRSLEMSEQIIDLMSKTAGNDEFFTRLKGWLEVFEKDGYSYGGKQ